MSKVLILIYHRSLGAFLSELKQLGLVHVDVRSAADDEKTVEKTKLITHIKNVLKSMNTHADRQAFHDAPLRIIEKYEDLRLRREHLAGQLTTVQNQIKKQTPWGEFDPGRIRALARETGIKAHICVVPKKKFKKTEWAQQYYAVVSDNGHYLYCIVFEKDTLFDPVLLHAEKVALPDKSLSVLKKEETETREAFEQLQIELLQLAQYRDAIESYLIETIDECAYDTVFHNLPDAVDGKIYVLNGWIPRGKRSALEETLKKHDVAYAISRPETGDKVPVLLKNNRFSKLFEPITKLFDLPHYRELDLTPMFAPFFALFFGLCLGDAGYGLIIFAASTIIKQKKPVMKNIGTLGQILGVMTLFIGVITGTFFGIDTSKIIFTEKFVLFTQNQLFYAAIVIGLTQVLFGMVIRVINQGRQYGFFSSLPPAGWIFIITGFIIMGFKATHIGMSLSIFGALLILFFNDMKAKIFMRIGKGLWELYGITGIFGDVLSYIRLFALGLSSAILGLVINQMAQMLRTIPWVGFVLALVFLIIGHTGNLLLSSLSSFVHPLRLTFVEFYKNAGFAGGGKGYQPLGGIKT